VDRPLGRSEEALAALDDLAGRPAEWRHDPTVAWRLPWHRGEILRSLGRRDEALASFRRALGAGPPRRLRARVEEAIRALE